MAQRRQEIEAFMRHLIVEIEAAEAAGMTAPQAIADHFNAKGVTTRKGRRWTGATVAKFLSSPGAKRYRSGGKEGRTVKLEGIPDKPSNAFDKARLRHISEMTIGHYDRVAEDYWDGTRNHDVSQNYEVRESTVGSVRLIAELIRSRSGANRPGETLQRQFAKKILYG